jgi:hypothetical protein
MCEFEQIYNKTKMKLAGPERVSGTKETRERAGKNLAIARTKVRRPRDGAKYRIFFFFSLTCGIGVKGREGGEEVGIWIHNGEKKKKNIYSKAYSTATEQASFDAASCPC